MDLTAKEFIKKLENLQTAKKDTELTSVKMGQIFALAKEFIDMPVSEIEKLMESEIHKVKVGALSIMGQSAKNKKVTEERLDELYKLYIKRHDRIDTWDLVDLAGHYVVGKYLSDKPRDILYKLAKSKSMAERRTAIFATAYFIMKLKEVEDTFKISEILVDDKEKFVQTGVGWMLRTAGDVDRKALLKFLDKYAAKMPRIMLRYSVEKLEKVQRERYMQKL